MPELYEIRIEARFSALHQLRLYDGTLEPLHGHDWRVEAVFRGPRLDGIDVLIDFERAREALGQVLASFEYSNLNELGDLAGHNPSAEVIAHLIFQRLRQKLGPDQPLAAVYVEEAPGCIAGYLKNDS